MNRFIAILKNIFIRKTIKEINFVLESFNFKTFVFAIKTFFLDNKNKVKDLENYFKNKLNVEHVIAFDFGRTGLYAIAKNIEKISEKDNIIVPGFSCVVVRNSIVAAGFKVKYADVNYETFTPDLEHLDKVIDTNTRAIIVQHVFGKVADNIDQIRKRYPHLIIIEDCAHTIDSKFSDGTFVGTKGDYSFFSFEQSKPISSFEGGIVVSQRDSKNIQKIRDSLLTTDWKDDIQTVFKIIITFIFNSKYANFVGKYFVVLVYKLLKFKNSMTQEELNGLFILNTHKQLSDYKASLILFQLSDLKFLLEHRNIIASIYTNKLGTKYKSNNMYLRYPLIVKNKDKILKKLSLQGYILGNWFNSPIHPVDINKNPLDYYIGSCPTAEELCRSIINLPTGYKITEKEALKLRETIEVYKSDK
jgi:dTDP-4-amino-4,6-dideoxygalactose transaminase